MSAASSNPNAGKFHLRLVCLVCGLRVGLVLQQAALAIARERPSTYSQEKAPDSKAHGSEA